MLDAGYPVVGGKLDCNKIDALVFILNLILLKIGLRG